jgi:uncharacterized protein YukE
MELIGIFLNLKPEGWLVFFAIMVPLFIWVLWVCLNSFSILNTEKGHLNILRVLLQKHGESESLLEREDLEPEIQKMPRHSFVRRMCEGVLNSRQMAQPDIEALLNLIGAREQLKLGAVRNAPNLLMLAGLLGTVLGLAASIGTLGPQVAQAAKASNPLALSESLGQTLGQMQGAFGSSLWGIFFSLLASMLLGAVSSARLSLVGELQDFALIDLIPKTFARSTEEQFERQIKMVKQNSNIFRQFDTTMNATLDRFNVLVNTSGESLEKTLTHLESMTQEVGGALEQVTAQVGTLGEQLREGAVAMSEAQDRATRTFGEARQNLETQLIGQAKNFTDLQERFGVTSIQIIERVDGVAERLNRTVEAFQDAAKNDTHEGRNLRDKLDERFGRLEQVLGSQIEVQHTSLEAVILNVKQAFGDLENVHKQGIELLERSVRESQVPLLESKATFEMWQVSLQTTLQSFKQLFSGVSNKIDLTLGQMKDTAQNNTLVLEGLQPPLEQVAESLATSIKVFQVVSENGSIEGRNLRDKLSERFDQLEQMLSNQIATQHTSLTAVTVEIIQAFAILENAHKQGIELLERGVQESQIPLLESRSTFETWQVSLKTTLQGFEQVFDSISNKLDMTLDKMKDTTQNNTLVLKDLKIPLESVGVSLVGWQNTFESTLERFDHLLTKIDSKFFMPNNEDVLDPSSSLEITNPNLEIENLFEVSPRLSP